MKRVLVTGGSGKAGRACVRDLLEHGYEVINVDAMGPSEALCPFVQADLTDFGQALEALSEVDSRHKGVDAVVHLAAIPAPGRHTNAVTFRNNILSTYNVFEAARKLVIRNLVWASSETVLGLPFDEPPPYAPLDEEYSARPETAYSLSKFLGEEMAQQFCRWDPEMKIIGLRLSNVMEPADYARFASFEADPQSRRWNLWGYIDARDAAQAVRKALEASLKGAEVFIIANADTVMSRPNAELMAEFYPDVALTREVEPNETLLSIGKAQRLLGYKPRYGWRTAPSS
ncbi:NAD-dependent epimerase/dehydratase family protein [Microvirga yunnanensis]|uniref:NAD-dependent epimerase/dehydratase family protein n=1 Tax=Microvirga yunnanensis TaxID=2953740 RepID=UPI0021C95BB7|nr:NAD(P)-dependent oxidoreductase [Microvirga sp. HBU65207]